MIIQGHGETGSLQCRQNLTRNKITPFKKIKKKEKVRKKKNEREKIKKKFHNLYSSREPRKGSCEHSPL